MEMKVAPTPPTMERPIRHPVVSDEMIAFWFHGTNFGCEPTVDNWRKLLANGLLKHQAGWHNGHTMQQLIKLHELVNKRGHINKRGRMFLWQFFKSSNV